MQERLSGLINTELQIHPLTLETSVLLEARRAHQDKQHCMLVLDLDIFLVVCFVPFVFIPNLFQKLQAEWRYTYGCSSTYTATTVEVGHLSFEPTGKATWLRQGSLGWKFIDTAPAELHQGSIFTVRFQLQITAWNTSPFQLGLVDCASLERLQSIK